MNDVRTVDLVKGRYESHDEARTLIKNGFDAGILTEFGSTKSDFIDLACTKKKPHEGWLLAWWSRPKFIIDQPRPDGLRFRPNGWAELPDAEIEYLYEGALVVEE